jgi:hypothetical protein
MLRNGIKTNTVGKVTERQAGSVLTNFASLSKKLQCEPREGLSLATAKGFTLEFSGQIFRMYESLMNSVHHNLVTIDKSDETGISVLQTKYTRILGFFFLCLNVNYSRLQVRNIRVSN